LSASRPWDDDREQTVDEALTPMLERDGLDPVQRALEGLLKHDHGDAKDNPPISLVFDRFKAERRPSDLAMFSGRIWRDGSTGRGPT
jgi:hypothetical protein